MTAVASEKEAIELAVSFSEMENKSDSSNKYYIGTPLYDRTQENGAIWNIVVINDTQKVYGTGWNYISTGTDIQDYGKTKYAWLVNYNTGDVIQLEDSNYLNLDYTSSLAVTDNLILNIDPSNMSDDTSWGSNVRLLGVEDGDGYGWNGTEINLDGVNDYIEVYTGDFEITEGVTFEFYGKSESSIYMLGKTIVNEGNYFKRFRTQFVGKTFQCCMAGGGLIANSPWSPGNTVAHWIYKTIGENFNTDNGNYLTMTVDLNNDTITLYWNGEYVDETVCDHNWIVGGGLTDKSIPFTIGMIVQGDTYTEYYSKVSLYCCRLYNKLLNSEEVKSNYNATVAYHNLSLDND